MTEATKEPTEPKGPSHIKVGTPRFENDQIRFEGTYHPHIEAHEAQASEASRALFDKLKEDAEYNNRLESKAVSLPESEAGQFRQLMEAHAGGTHDRMAEHNLPENLRKARDEFLTQEGAKASKEYETFQGANDKVRAAEREMYHAENTHLKDLTPEQRAAVHSEETAFAKALENRESHLKQLSAHTAGGPKSSLLTGLKELGVMGTLKHNLSFAKGHRLNSALRAAGVAGGVYTALDAVGRSEAVGDDGKPQPRSGAERMLKFVGGASVALGSALLTRGRSHGHALGA